MLRIQYNRPLRLGSDLNIACFPDEHADDLVERQIARERDRRENEMTDE